MNSIYMNGNTTSGIGYGYLRNSVFKEEHISTHPMIGI